MRDYKVKINLVDANGNSFASNYFKQFDNGTDIELELYTNDTETSESTKIDLTGKSVLAFCKLSNGSVLQKNCIVKNQNAILKTTKDITGIVGNLEIEFFIKDEEEEITSNPVTFVVRSIIPQKEVVQGDPNYYSDLVGDLVDIKNNLDSKLNGKANQIEVDAIKVSLTGKRDKADKIKGEDLDISTDDNKIKLINLSDEVINAMTGTTSVNENIGANAITTEKIAPKAVTPAKIQYTGIEKNKGVLYPLKAISRDGVISEDNTLLYNILLDVKVFNAEPNKYYRIGWMGFGADIGGVKQYGINIESYDIDTYNTNSMSSQVILNNYKFTNMSQPTEKILTRRIDSTVNDTYFLVTYDTQALADGESITMNTSAQRSYSAIISPENYFYKNIGDNNMYIKVNADKDVIITKTYNSTSNIQITFGKWGANSIYNIKDIRILRKTDNAKLKEIFVGNSTDWFAPQRFKVINNIDGDHVTGAVDFTGGNHAFSGSAEGTPTGRTSDIKIYIDNIDVAGVYEGYSNDLKICFTNLIQASNTKKTDGTGREALKEERTVICKDGEIYTNNYITALEDLTMYVYYGNQAVASYYTDIFYNSSNNMKWNAITTEGTESGGHTCEKAVLKKDTDYLEMSVNRQSGLGATVDIGETTSDCFTSNMKKAYFRLIYDNVKTLSANDVLYYEGSYRFYSK